MSITCDSYGNCTVTVQLQFSFFDCIMLPSHNVNNTPMHKTYQVAKKENQLMQDKVK